MTVLGIGVDIVRSSRFAEILAKNPHRLKRLQQRILHPLEICHDGAEEAILRKLSSSWAAKEALYKSLSPPEQKMCRFNEWRRVWGPLGFELISDKPRSDQVLLSLSHDGEYTVAYVLRQANPASKRSHSSHNDTE